MFRDIFSRLDEWRASTRRKPLLLMGARQVGKTWTLREFGARAYESCVHVDFERQEEFREFFRTTKDPRRIVENLELATGQPIFPERTLLILDEIQECPEALASLKYFCEDAPDYHVAAAGSLLGIALAGDASYPVGKVHLMELRPMTFCEFLRAEGDGRYADYLQGIRSPEPIPAAFFNPLVEKLRLYFLTGGLPESVLVWTRTHDTGAVQETLRDLAQLYELDFHKHASAVQVPKIDLVWRSIPSQLARENKKFLYSLVRTGARAREYEDAVQWLVNARMLTRVRRSSAPGLPVSAYDELSAFKLYLLDVGLLRRHSGLEPTALAEGARLFTEFKGALTENYVLQELLCQYEQTPRYWAVDNPRYEVDFLVQHDNRVVPVEVKAGGNVRATGLRKYREKYGDRTEVAVRLSLRNLSLDDGILNVPLFMAGQLRQLLDAVL